MKPSYLTALVVGSLTGGFLAIALMLYAGATGGVPSVDAVPDGSLFVPVFSPPASSLWSMVILLGAFGGFVVATGTRAVARIIDPDAPSVSAALIATLGTLTAPIIGMTVFPLGVIVLGSIEEGTVTIGVIEMSILTGIAGLVAGGLIAWLSYVLARPPADEADTSLHMDMVDRSA